jgi:hypothetical protein
MQMTKQEFEARQLIGNWLAKNKIKLISKLRHVHPRCYVIGHAGPLCLVIAQSWKDSEPQLAEFDRANPLKHVYKFDQTLKAGDWCAVAYYRGPGIGEHVAVGWTK